MSDLVDAAPVKKAERAVEVDALIREIQRYLRYLDALRTASRPPPTRRSGRRRHG